jgi:hypothetical protein
MIMISKYLLEKIGENIFRVCSSELSICPICASNVIVIGTRERTYIWSYGERHHLIIRRLRCIDCKKIHHELPDLLIPYKRHCAETFEKIVAGDHDGIPCEESTVRRLRSWWESFTQYFESIIISLREKYGIVFSSNPMPKEIVKITVNTNFWVHTRSAFL